MFSIFSVNEWKNNFMTIEIINFQEINFMNESVIFDNCAMLSAGGIH